MVIREGLAKVSLSPCQGDKGTLGGVLMCEVSSMGVAQGKCFGKGKLGSGKLWRCLHLFLAVRTVGDSPVSPVMAADTTTP